MILKRASYWPDRQTLLWLIGSAVIVGLLAFWQRDFLLIQIFRQYVSITPNATFYDQPTEVELSSKARGTIHYTLNGETPTAESPIYSEPIKFEKSGLIQFALFRNKQEITPVQSRDIIVQDNRTLPVVSIVTEPDNLWDSKTGIYVAGEKENYRQVGDDWEKPAKIRLYEKDGSLGFEHHVKLMLSGMSMRPTPQKSFRLDITDAAGHDDKFVYPLFGPGSTRQYESFVLRTGDSNQSFIRNQLSNLLVEQSSNLEVLKARPVVVYLNGEYWGMYYLQDRFDATYFGEKYKVDKDALGIVEIPLGGVGGKAKVIAEEEDLVSANAYNKLLRSIDACADCGTYSYLNSEVEMRNLIDYYFFEFYFGNTDWPLNNYKAWQYKSEERYTPESEIVPQLDGRFRMLYYDLDAAMGINRKSDEDMLRSSRGTPYSKLLDPNFPFTGMFSNYVFKKLYWQRSNDLLTTTLHPDNVDKTIDSITSEIRAEMPRQIERWGNYTDVRGTHVVKNMEEWERYVNMLKVYFRARPAFFAESTLELYRYRDEN